MRDRWQAIWTVLVFVFILAPIASIVVFSFNADRFPSLPWGGFSLTWYQAILTDDTVIAGLIRSLKVSAVLTARLPCRWFVPMCSHSEVAMIRAAWQMRARPILVRRYA